MCATSQVPRIAGSTTVTVIGSPLRKCLMFYILRPGSNLQDWCRFSFAGEKANEAQLMVSIHGEMR